MADSTQPPVEPSKKKRGNLAALNQAQVQALTKAEQICLAAQKPDYASALAGREITSAIVTQLLTDIIACRGTSSAAMQSTTSKESASVDEDNSEDELMVALQEVQAAARQKYARTNPVMLQDYFIGVRINQSRPLLEQYSQSILSKLDKETLPGITPVKKTNLVTLRQAYMDANSGQGDNQSEATKARKQRDQQIQNITDRRVTIQFAADAEWPFSDDTNAGTRREFYLPLSQPFHG